jgi:hypothetical protein
MAAALMSLFLTLDSDADLMDKGKLKEIGSDLSTMAKSAL